MICNLHKITYVLRCPKCADIEDMKDRKLAEIVGSKTKVNWNDNPLYESNRAYNPSFRQKVSEAQKLILQGYGKRVDINKFQQLMGASYSGHLDDVFYVAPDAGEWANVVHALGGKQGPVYDENDGRFLGIMQSYGCTTYSRVNVDPGTKAATTNLEDDMRGILDDSKRIYLHGTSVGVATLVHEMLHFVCNKKFFDRFSYNRDPGWRSINEGVTECLTRGVCPSQKERAYEEEYQSVKLLLDNGLKETDLQAAYFTGELQSFESTIQEINEMLQAVNFNVSQASQLTSGRVRPGRGKHI